MLSQHEEEHKVVRWVEHEGVYLEAKIFIGKIDFEEQTLDIDPKNIIQRFKLIGEDSNGDDQYGEKHCICGHEIKHSYLIKNIETGKKATVGSKCVERFYGLQLEEYNNKKKQKKQKKKKTIYTCIDCKINIVDGYNCICDDC
eukprot:277438_1